MMTLDRSSTNFGGRRWGLSAVRVGAARSLAWMMSLTLVLTLALSLMAPRANAQAAKPDPGGVTTGTHNDITAVKAGSPTPAEVMDQVGQNKIAINFTWTLICGFFVLFMQAGFALLTTGLVRTKNAGHLMMLNFAAYVVCFIAYYLVGFAFQFGGVSFLSSQAPASLGGTPTLTGLFPAGHWGLIGTKGWGLSGAGYDVGAFALFMFEVVFMETAGYIIVGAICERITFSGFVLAEIFVGGILYPIFGCWVWGGGWLSQIGTTMHLGHGYCDFAGSTVVHAIGGYCAMALAIILGPRIGKFNKDGTPNAFPGHNLAFVVTGTFILLFGWMGFNPGSTLGASGALRISVIAVNTNLAACCGAITAMWYTSAKWGKPDISMACNGMLAGLVAITAPCAFVAAWAACVIGLVAGLLVCLGVAFNDYVTKIDDPCGAISVHGFNGTWGALSLGLFADGTYGAGWNGVNRVAMGGANDTVKGLFYGDPSQFLAQLFGVCVNFLWAFGLTFIVFKIVNSMKTIRVKPEDELAGLDMAQFGALCYPELPAPVPSALGSDTSSGAGVSSSKRTPA